MGRSDEICQIKKKSIVISIGNGYPAGFITEYSFGSIDGNRFLEDSILLEPYTCTGRARAWDEQLFCLEWSKTVNVDQVYAINVLFEGESLFSFERNFNGLNEFCERLYGPLLYDYEDKTITLSIETLS